MSEVKHDDYSLKKYMEQASGPTLDTRKVWRGSYRGVRYEIQNFSLGNDKKYSNCWTHYIFINLDGQLEKDLADQFWLEADISPIYEGGRPYLRHNYLSCDVINKLDFHGGCTFYSKEAGLEGGERVVKIGCDYQHFWDDSNEYNLDFVYAEVKNTINSLWTLARDQVKYRSWGDGKYRLESEFT